MRHKAKYHIFLVPCHKESNYTMINLFDAFLAAFQTGAWELLVKSSVLWDCPVYSNSFSDLVYQFLYRLSPECPKAGDDSFTDGQTQDADVFEDSAGVWTEARNHPLC